MTNEILLMDTGFGAGNTALLGSTAKGAKNPKRRSLPDAGLVYTEAMSGSGVSWSGTVSNIPISIGKFRVEYVIAGITYISETDENGKFSDVNISSNTVNFETGAYSITFSTSPTGTPNAIYNVGVLDGRTETRETEATVNARSERSITLTPDIDDNPVLSFRFGDDALFERIWLSPTVVASEFIVDIETHDIQIWNAYLSDDKDWTAVLATLPDGTSVNSPTLPVTISAMGTYDLVLTVDKTGPPVQDTEWQFTVDSLDFTLDVTGMRVLDIVYEPNWDKKPSIEYQFQTTIFSSPYLKEQRRALSAKSWRDISVSYLLDDVDAQSLFNLVAYGHDKIFGVPVYNEQIYSASFLQGASQITTSTDFGKHWNMKNRAAYIYIVDHPNKVGEVKVISSLPNDLTILLDQPITGDYDANSTVVYPVILSLVHGFKTTQESGKVDSVTIDFKEFR